MTSLRSRYTSASWKGKQRASQSDSDIYSEEKEREYRDVSSRSRAGRRDGLSGVEGDGGQDGIVLPLDMVGGGFYEAVYTVSISVGLNNQNMSVQVDMGSSDLWLASKQCSTSACSSTGGRLYDPSTATATNVDFSINYLAGSVTGPIYWDQVTLGGYTVSNQALAAATTVDSEPLEYEFDGILGLALPLNSVIAQQLPATTSDAPDGAVFASNLFGLAPSTSAPSSRFISLSLARPGSTSPSSFLGIGRHPSEILDDPSKVTYSRVLAESTGEFFWRLNVRGLTVYVDGDAKQIDLGRGKSGGVFPSAVLDSGVPVILTSTSIANGIYGALGIGPASDGNYYVPCTTPLNMTITLDGQSETTLHPLDLTAFPQQAGSTSTTGSCIGLIQTANGEMDDASSGLDDFVLGVPFLRNTYTVMAYEVPDSNGNFNASGSGTGTEMLNDDIDPRLGLLGLTDPTKALEEFNTVRVLNQPLSNSNSSSSGTGASASGGDKKLSVGLDVLIGLVGFFAFCLALFGARWWFMRRRWRRAGGRERGVDEFADGDRKMDVLGGAAYRLARRTSETNGDDERGHLSEDTLRAIRFEEYKRRTGVSSSYTTDSGRTHVGSGMDMEFGEFGYEAVKARARKWDGSKDRAASHNDPWDPRYTFEWRDTLVDEHAPADVSQSKGSDGGSDRGHEGSIVQRRSSGYGFGHERSASDVTMARDGGAGVAEPLLARTRDASIIQIHGEDGSVIANMDSSLGMAGIGAVSARVSSMHGRTASGGSVGSVGVLGGSTGVRPGSTMSGRFGDSVSPGMLLPPTPSSPRFPRVAPSPPPLDVL